MRKSTAVINSSSLDNVKKQFKQDCQLVFGNHVYLCDLNSLSYVKAGLPIDKDGFPTPVAVRDLPTLADKMTECYATARRKFIDRVSDLEVKSMTVEKAKEDELAE